MFVKNILVAVILILNQINLANFAANVPVRIWGGYRAINSFRGEDLVRSYLETEGVINCKVAHVNTKVESIVVEIWLDDEMILASPDQYFYSVSFKCWRMAQELVVGEQLLADSSSPVIVKQVHKLKKELTLYNLTVADTRTYFVSKSRVLVCGPAN